MTLLGTLLSGAFTVLCVSAGVGFFLAGTLGLLRFPGRLARLHALTKADTLGVGLVILGLLPQAADLRSAVKMIAIGLLVLLSSGAVSQVIAGLAVRDAGPEGDAERADDADTVAP